MREGVVVLIMNSRRDILFIQRGPLESAPGFWCPVSGGIEPGEAQDEAVMRESLEEVGLDVLPVERIAQRRSERGGLLLHWWRADLVQGEPRIASPEVTGIRWVSRAELHTVRPTFERDLAFLDAWWFAHLQGAPGDSRLHPGEGETIPGAPG